jgi:hypothetical protein
VPVARRRKGRRLAHCDWAAFLVPQSCGNEPKKAPPFAQRGESLSIQKQDLQPTPIPSRRLAQKKAPTEAGAVLLAHQARRPGGMRRD